METGNGGISDGAGSPVCLPAAAPPLPSTLPPPTNSVWPSPGHWPPRTPGLGLRPCPLGCLGPWMPDQILHPSQDHICFHSSSSATGSGDERYPECTISPTASAGAGGGVRCPPALWAWPTHSLPGPLPPPLRLTSACFPPARDHNWAPQGHHSLSTIFLFQQPMRKTHSFSLVNPTPPPLFFF